jgi:hypothetical protein
MRITSIAVTNLAAFKDFKTTLPAVGIISGAHGVGKSSIERIIMYAFGLRPLAEKGQKAIMHDPTILHGASDKGEAIISFDGDLESLRVRVSADKTERTIKVRGKKSWELAGQQIYDITNALSYNPLQFRDLNPKERLEAFLKVVPVTIAPEEIKTAVGGVIPLIESERPSLESINSIYDDIFKARTTANSTVDVQTKYAAQLEAALGPAAPGDNWDAEVARLREDERVLNASEQAEIARIGKELSAKKDQATETRRNADISTYTAINTAVNELRSQIQKLEKAIGVLETQRAEEKGTAATAESATVATLRANANAEVSELRTANAPLRQKLTADIATAEERARKSAQDEGTRKAAEEAKAQAQEHGLRAKSMTEALDRLKDLKAEVAGRMSIKGVEIASPREGQPVDICRREDGALVPYSNWNDADADAFALRMAVLYRGPCGLVMVDNTGNWNASRKASIIDRCRKLAASDGMQFLLGEATEDGELRIVDASVPA